MNISTSFYRLFRRSTALAWVVMVCAVAHAQFSQSGIVKEYNRREQHLTFKSPVEIIATGAGSTVSGTNGNFNLLFPTGRVGDRVANIAVNPVNPQYTLFNAPKIQDWILTPNRYLEVLVCNKAIIDDVQRTYTTNYVKDLTERYQKQKRQLELQLKAEREGARQSKQEIERLNGDIAALKEQFRRDSLDIVARSVVFAYVDETELDSLELVWRDCILAGDFKEAVRVGNEMKLTELSATRLANLDKSVVATREQLEETYKTAQILEQHIVNMEGQEELPADKLGYSKQYVERNSIYYESLVQLYSRLFELYTTEYRCSEDFLNSLKDRYAQSLFKYANVCQRVYYEYLGLVLPCEFSKEGLENVMIAADLDMEEALMELCKMESLGYDVRRNYIKRTRMLCDNAATKELDWRLVDFAAVANGDTLYCHKLDAPDEVAKYGENAVLVCSIHASGTGRKLVVPAEVTYEGATYEVKVLGGMACNVGTVIDEILHGKYLYPEHLATKNGRNITQKEEIEIGEGIVTLGKNCIGGWFKKIAIPNSVTEMCPSAIPSYQDVKVKLGKRCPFALKDGILYSKDMSRIVAFVSKDIKEISVNSSLMFDDVFFGLFSPISFPDSLQRFIVDPQNPYYYAAEGMLMDKQKDSLLYIPKCVPCILLDKRTLSMIQYRINDVNAKSASTNRYITAYGNPNCKKYIVGNDIDSVGRTKVFDYFMTVYCGSKDGDVITIATADGHERGIPDFIETMLPLMTVERLTFWGRTCLGNAYLDRQKLGLKILEFAKDRFGTMYTDEAKYPIAWSFLYAAEYSNYTAYHEGCALNRIKALAQDGGYDYEPNIASDLQAIGDFTAALEYIDLAIEKDTAKAMNVLTKSDILFAMGRYDEAVEMASEYVAKSKSAYGYYKRAFFYDNLGNTDRAIEDYTTAIRLAPSYAYSYLGRGDKYQAKGDSALAKRDYEKVLTLLQSGQSRCDQYAHCMLGNYEKAKSVMNDVLQWYPNTPGVYYDAACLYSRMGDYASSLNYFKTALEKGYRNIGHLMIDDDLEHIRQTGEFKQLYNQYFATALH